MGVGKQWWSDVSRKTTGEKVFGVDDTMKFASWWPLLASYAVP